jgi:adenylate cyclase
MKQPGERRLAAILAADVAGYSRLMRLDEAGTALAVREPAAEALLRSDKHLSLAGR